MAGQPAAGVAGGERGEGPTMEPSAREPAGSAAGGPPAAKTLRPEIAEPWHSEPAHRVLERLASAPTGLDAAEAGRRLDRWGPNRLPAQAARGPLRRFLAQFNNLLIYALLAAAALAIGIGHFSDAAVVLAVVVLNAIIGFVQEGRAERALDGIRAMVAPAASVVRGGQRLTVTAEAVVPGDIVLLEAGDRVPADVRLIRASQLRIDEAALTGESVPVEKAAAAVAAGAVLGERSSMAYSGTFVAAGQGSGVAVATGAATELGRIGTLIGAVEPLRTPLVRQMDHFARQVTLAVFAVSVLVFAWAALSGRHGLDEVFMAVVGLAVAAIPEGLPAVMTIALAVGVRRMARHNAIIRRLPAVETLGAVSVICTDKTGTLTRNEMTVADVVTVAGCFTVSGSGYEPAGDICDAAGRPVPAAADPVLGPLCLAGLVCNDAGLRTAGTGPVVDGDPMEGALVVLALKAGLDPAAGRGRHRRRDEIPFETRHRYMATCHDDGAGGAVVFIKGAPERVLQMCPAALGPDGPVATDPAFWLAAVERLAAGGERVIALARAPAPRPGSRLAPADLQGRATLLGLVGLIDPPRPEAVAAVAECRAAGIAIKMITGDHAATARAVAMRLGLADDPRVLTGQDLDRLDPGAFAAGARAASVFARTTPEHKLRLVEALQSDGAIIAMTGDGVNDAPALKRADVGVAMGAKGSEAAKEASEMILADDNFATIVAAVREGRTVFDNLTKVIAWTLPTNAGEGFVVVAALLLGVTMPITPIQILWVNMVTAVALGLTLAFERTEPGTMQRAPRAAQGQILSGRLAFRVLFVSLLMAGGAFVAYELSRRAGLDVPTAQTMVVNTIVAIEIVYLYSVRHVPGSGLSPAALAGPRAVSAGVVVTLLAQVAFTHLPAMNAIFGSRAPDPAEGLIVVAIAAAVLVVVEIEKAVARRLGCR